MAQGAAVDNHWCACYGSIVAFWWLHARLTAVYVYCSYQSLLCLQHEAAHIPLASIFVALQLLRSHQNSWHWWEEHVGESLPAEMLIGVPRPDSVTGLVTMALLEGIRHALQQLCN